MNGRTKAIGQVLKAILLATPFVVLAVVAISSTTAAANSYTVSISEKEMKLEQPVDMMWDKWLMWDIGYQRMMCRNTPYIELLNDGSSSSPITEFHITIGDNRFNFGPVDGTTSPAKLGSTTPGFSLSSSTVGNLGDELVVTIGNGGLLPGQLVRFQINLDVDPAYAATYAASFGASQPDFRTILFDMNGLNVYDGVVKSSSDDNAQTYAIFSQGGKSAVSVFEDESVAAGQYYNNNLRTYRAMDPVLIFQLEGSQAIPEPSTIGLAMLGLSVATLFRGRSRRS